jgi:hypothetical protein
VEILLVLELARAGLQAHGLDLRMVRRLLQTAQILELLVEVVQAELQGYMLDKQVQQPLRAAQIVESLVEVVQVGLLDNLLDLLLVRRLLQIVRIVDLLVELNQVGLLGYLPVLRMD